MSLTLLATAVLVAVFVTAGLVRILRKVAFRRDWVDRPDGKRKMHARPVPYVGGLAMVGGFVAATLYISGLNLFFDVPIFIPTWAFWAGGLMVVLTGFIDDIIGLDFKHKFAVQILAAFVLIQAGYRFDLSNLWFLGGDMYNAAMYSVVLTMLWIVGIMNAVNLIDGLDGLAGGVVLIAFACLGAVFGIQGGMDLVAFSLIMGGAIVAFLAYNTSPASVFMGDAGSLFLGYVLAAFSLQTRAHADPLVGLLLPMVVLGLPVLDTTLSIIRRFSTGESVCAPDKDHIHHRLSRRWSPQHAVFILYGAAATFGLLAVLMAMSTPPVALLVTAMAAFIAIVAITQIGYRPVDMVSALFRRMIVWQTESTSPPEFSAAEGTAIPEFVASGTVAPPVEALETATASDLRSSGDGSAGANVPVLDYEFSNPSTTITEHSVVEVEESLTSAKLGDEAVLLDLTTGCYFGVNEVGTSIVDRIKTPKPVSSLMQELRQEYDVESDILKNDVLGFLQKMHGKRLVRQVSLPYPDGA